jgi:hypothetical protein
MYISRLKLENWKNFKSGEICIGHRLFIVGPNASGKSNLLDGLRFLRDLSVSGGGLHQATDVLRGGVSAIRCLAARRYPDISLDIDITDDNQTDVWRYRIAFTQDNNRRPIITEELVEHNGVEVLRRPDDDDREDPLRRTETALEQTTANRGFRPVVQFLQSISYQHLLPQVIRDPSGFSPGKVENDPFGRDFLQRVESTVKKTRDSRLRKILQALKVAAPQLTELRVDRDSLGIPHLIGTYSHWRPHGGRQNEGQFSDGTLRLFGLLWTLFEGNGPLLMEEPELSLHSEVVRLLPQLVERIHRDRKIKRQILVSTHSEEMLSDPSISASEVIRLEPSDEGTLLLSPENDPSERALLEQGLTVADVVLPKSAPRDARQLILAFSK